MAHVSSLLSISHPQIDSVTPIAFSTRILHTLAQPPLALSPSSSSYLQFRD